MSRAPAENLFPSYPAAWYLFGRSRDLRDEPASKQMLGRRLVAYRTTAGRVAVLDAACSHQGADLGRGRVVKDCLQCPFHQWEFSADGRCLRIPTQNTIPPFAQQRAYPVVERHGFIFLFNGEQPLFPLPFFLGHQPEDFLPGRLFSFVAECSWFLLTGNGFDTAHFQTVHDRQLVSDPIVDCPATFARRMHFVTRVTGNSRADRFIRAVVGEIVEVTITNWGGPLVAVTGRFGGATSYMLIMTKALEANKTFVEVVVFAPRAKNAFVRRLIQPCILEVRRWLTMAFLNDDRQRLPGIRYNPRTMIHADRELIHFLQWLVALPQSAKDLARSDELNRESQDQPFSTSEGSLS